MASHDPSTIDPAAQTAFDNSIWYILTLWAPMALALSNSFAGPLTSDKRDWLAGTISELITTRPETDAYDIEDILLQAMGDEFDLEVQDESEVGVAAEIMRLKREVLEEGRLEGAEAVRERWERLKGKKVGIVDGGEREEEVDSDEDVDVDGDGDEEMGEGDAVPALVERREKPEPEIDEDGFTKVVGRRKR